MNISADAYMNEPVRYSVLQAVNLQKEGAKVADPYRSMVINRVNVSCLKLAVFGAKYLWHYHPKSDELFIVDEMSAYYRDLPLYEPGKLRPALHRGDAKA